MKRVEALRGQQGLSSKVHGHRPKDRPQLGGHGGQGGPGRAQGHRTGRYQDSNTGLSVSQ